MSGASEATRGRGRRASAIAAAVLLALAARPAAGAGLSISEWGAHALGMANAVTALADTPSAVVFNPAGLAQLEGLALEGGVTLIAPRFGYTLPVPGASTEVDVQGERVLYPVPSAFASYRIHDRIAAGLGVYSMYGLGIEWPQQVRVPGEDAPRAWWARGQVQEDSLQTAYIAPTLAARLHERVLLGAGLTIVQAAVYFKRAVTLSASREDDIQLEVSAEDVAFGANAGVLLKVIPRLLNVGLAYRGGVQLDFAGNAAFSKRRAAVPAALRAQLVDSRVRAALDLPHVFSFGAAVFPLPQLTLGLVGEISTWSSYRELAFDLFDESGARNEQLSAVEPKDWRNSLTLRVGLQYLVLPQLPVRLGLAYDETPVPETTMGPDLPDADRYELSLGAGLRYKGFSADLAYLFLITGDRDTAPTAPLVGTARAHAHLVGLTLGYAFPKL